uniref:Tartrateresistant acid phosphatase type 5 putative n=1 Tax=Albugo laibachii Nc14 TaxID=890382 RepID=F0WPJ2_9STRA|nr:tartrateresistant acid phosphatase type 5 putative [Albugo laibachii Nc14]|eukprot:CCA23240.1 tartrateresistant acid phosphatase type 5 putative [Albugo laibachii Nc14]
MTQLVEGYSTVVEMRAPKMQPETSGRPPGSRNLPKAAQKRYLFKFKHIVSVMLLEAGLCKKNDDDFRNEVPRLTAQCSTYQYNAVSKYEHWLKVASCSFLCFWLLTISYHWLASSSVSPSHVDPLEEEGVLSDEIYHIDVGNELINSQPTHFLVVGDYGTGTEPQAQVAAAMGRLASTMDPAPIFVISTGDQIYNSGIQSPDDPELRTRFEQMYTSTQLEIPWYITIGNHDCEGSIDAMHQYASRKESLWYFPKRYYTLDRLVTPKTIIRILVLDVCDLVCGKEPRDGRCNGAMLEQTSPQSRSAQYEWIEDTLSARMPEGVEKMWTIVVGHWAVYSFAGNANTPELIHRLDPILKKHKVDAYFNGHDHCMQHIIKREDGWTRNYFVSGAGGYRIHELQPHARANSDLVHAAMQHGFMSVQIDRESFTVYFHSIDGEVLYATRIQQDSN